ncbi:hypothetical protein CFP56_030039 [Quercus suber]|uniref:Uncharacterized protein n=1 Tax=Quercus suber TaxID=58331 RepID=A0AAW0JR45_QUESU
MMINKGQLLFEEQRIRDDFDKDNGNGVVLNPICQSVAAINQSVGASRKRQNQAVPALLLLLKGYRYSNKRYSRTLRYQRRVELIQPTSITI